MDRNKLTVEITDAFKKYVDHGSNAAARHYSLEELETAIEQIGGQEPDATWHKALRREIEARKEGSSTKGNPSHQTTSLYESRSLELLRSINKNLATLCNYHAVLTDEDNPPDRDISNDSDSISE